MKPEKCGILNRMDKGNKKSLLYQSIFLIAFCISVDGREPSTNKISSDDIIQSIGKQLNIDVLKNLESQNIDDVDDWSTIKSLEYKVDPRNPKNTIVAIIFESEIDGFNPNTLRYVIAIVNNIQKNVLSSYDGGIEEDATLKIKPSSLWIDTAPYLLSKDARAFGVDITSDYIPNCGSGGSGAIRTLYLAEGKKIRPILKDFETSNWRYVQRGNDRCTSNEEAADTTIIESFNFILKLENTITNGFRDMAVLVTSTRDDGKKTKRNPFQYILKYDGQEYSTKEYLNKYYKWDEE